MVLTPHYYRNYSQKTGETLQFPKPWSKIAIGETFTMSSVAGDMTATFIKHDEKYMEYVTGDKSITPEPDYEGSRVLARAIKNVLYGEGNYQQKIDKLSGMEWPYEAGCAEEVFQWENPHLERTPTLEEFFILCYFNKSYYVSISPYEISKHKWKDINVYLVKLEIEQQRSALESISETLQECKKISQQMNPKDLITGMKRFEQKMK